MAIDAQHPPPGTTWFTLLPSKDTPVGAVVWLDRPMRWDGQAWRIATETC